MKSTKRTIFIASECATRRRILIAGMGTSPAVLTETVWALAHQKKLVVPDEIVVLATKNVVQNLQTEVIAGEPSVWKRLLAALKREKIDINGKLIFGTTSIHIIPDAQGNELADLRSGDENLLAADFMLLYSKRPSI